MTLIKSKMRSPDKTQRSAIKTKSKPTINITRMTLAKRAKMKKWKRSRMLHTKPLAKAMATRATTTWTRFRMALTWATALCQVTPSSSSNNAIKTR